MFSSPQISHTASTFFSAYGSLTGSLMLLRSIFYDFVPEQLRSYLANLLQRFCTPKQKDLTLIIDEMFGMSRNQVFDAAEMYLRTKISPKTKRLRVGKTRRQKHFSVSIDKGEEILDSFENIEMGWRYIQIENKNENANVPNKRYFELTFEKQFREKVIDSYLNHVLKKSKGIRKNLKAVKLYNQGVYSNSTDNDGRGSGSRVDIVMGLITKLKTTRRG